MYTEYIFNFHSWTKWQAWVTIGINRVLPLSQVDTSVLYVVKQFPATLIDAY